MVRLGDWSAQPTRSRRTTARDILDRHEAEDVLLGKVLELAALTRWMAYHVRRSDRAITIGMGFPDLVLAGRGRVLYRELKTETGRLTREQVEWRDRLLACGADWDVWRPSSWDEIEATLRKA